MSYSRQQEAYDDCLEINARIVARQKQAIAELERIQADPYTTDRLADTQRVIDILKGDLDLATPGILL